MQKPEKKRNNLGSTLLTVIICIGLVGILGSLMLSVTMTNLQMKVVESKSKNNFYSCEVAMDQIRIGIQELTASKIREVYEDEVLVNYNNYASVSEEQRAQTNKRIQSMVAVKILKELADTNALNDNDIIGAGLAPIRSDILEKFITFTDTEEEQVNASLISLSSSVEGNSIVVKDIKVEHIKGDYSTQIMSDIRVNIPEFTFVRGAEVVDYNMEPVFEDYVLIADGGIISDNLAGTTTINGSVYAGSNGITVNGQNSGNHVLNMKGDNIVTRGNLTIFDTAKLTIDKYLSGNAFVWADNIITNTSVNYNQASNLSTTLEINGSCFVDDDLAIEGRNSNVKIAGSYIGYTGAHTVDGSSVIINGSGSSLDLTGLNSLILAGRAHVSVQDVFTDKDAFILTGESLAFKSNQKAYLIPGTYIGDIKHNPVTAEDIAAGIPEVSFPDTAQLTELNYNTYINPSRKYKIAAMQTDETGSATTLRYFYMNFASGKLADQYLRDYISNAERLAALNDMDPFKLGDVKLPVFDPDSDPYVNPYISAGNLMAYDKVSGMTSLTDGLSKMFDNDNDLDSFILNKGLENAGITGEKVSDLPNLYSKITHLLKIDGTSRMYNSSDEVVVSNIIAGGINYIKTKAESGAWDDTTLEFYTGNSTYSNSDSLKQSFIIVDGDVTITANSILNGMLVATGNITIEDHAVINGMVISTWKENGVNNIIRGNITTGDYVTVNGRLIAAGNIILGTMNEMTVNEDKVLPVFQTEAEVLKNIFKNANTTINITYDISETNNFVDLSNMIYYENWRKD